MQGGAPSPLHVFIIILDKVNSEKERETYELFCTWSCTILFLETRWRDIRCSKQQGDAIVKDREKWVLVYFLED